MGAPVPINEAALRVKDPAKLAECRAIYAETGSLLEVSKRSGVSYNTLCKQKQKGLFDLDDITLQTTLATKAGPEQIRKVTELATELTIMAQERVREELHKVSAVAASRISVEQNNIRLSNEGRVTNTNVFISQGDFAHEIGKLFTASQTIDSEAVEIEAEVVSDS